MFNSLNDTAGRHEFSGESLGERGVLTDGNALAVSPPDVAADGFNIMPPLLPAQLDVFSAEVIPLLQRRGLFRTEYAGKTLREHYGLVWPNSKLDEPLVEEETI